MGMGLNKFEMRSIVDTYFICVTNLKTQLNVSEWAQFTDVILICPFMSICQFIDLRDLCMMNATRSLFFSTVKNLNVTKGQTELVPA